MNKEYFNGVGRRKNSTARVYLSDGKGKFSINNVSDDINSYLKRESLVIHAVKPLEVLNLKGKYDIKINVQGGGLTGQAGAIQLGIARALLKVDKEFRFQLKSHGLLTRDAREVERKKYGQPGARKKFQFSKR
jgi:small subunit ribosomal protein S9